MVILICIEVLQDVLKTDNNLIVGTLTPNRAVITDPTTNELTQVLLPTQNSVIYLAQLLQCKRN